MSIIGEQSLGGIVGDTSVFNRLLAEVREKVKGEGGKGRKIPFPFDLLPFPSCKSPFCKRSNREGLEIARLKRLAISGVLHE
jgi:hypothetical protein